MHLDNSCSLCRAIMHNPKHSTHVTTGIKLYLVFVLVFNKSEHIILQTFTCFFCKIPFLFSSSLKNMCIYTSLKNICIIYWMGYINLYNVLGRVAVQKLYFNNCTRLSNKVQINYVLYQNSRCIFTNTLFNSSFILFQKCFPSHFIGYEMSHDFISHNTPHSILLLFSHFIGYEISHDFISHNTPYLELFWIFI